MVLIVDDEPTVLHFLSLCIRQLGYSPIVTHSALHALRMTQEAGPFKLLVTDILMPEMNGIELADAIRKREPQLPILFVSANPEHHNEVTARIERGRTEFLPKPFNIEELQRKIKVLLNPP